MDFENPTWKSNWGFEKLTVKFHQLLIIQKINKILLTDDELNYLELLLNNHEYEENDRPLIDSLEFKFYKVKSNDHQNKVTTIGGN